MGRVRGGRRSSASAFLSRIFPEASGRDGAQVSAHEKTRRLRRVLRWARLGSNQVHPKSTPRHPRTESPPEQAIRPPCRLARRS
jgi:hypothetical protein